MFQKEFALRLVARPGTPLWCRLSANVQLYAKIDHLMNVSKNNFRPPPKVESAVVRLVPIDPPPAIRFEEFDGLTRILFARRNKIVRANFQASGVKEMLESNYKAWKASREESLEDGWDVSEVVEKTLQTSGYADQRPAKMDVDDFRMSLALLLAFTCADACFAVALLSAFNLQGIHFS